MYAVDQRAVLNELATFPTLPRTKGPILRPDQFL